MGGSTRVLWSWILGGRSRRLTVVVVLVGAAVVLAPERNESKTAISPRTCLGENPFAYQDGLAAIEVVRVIRAAWLVGDQAAIDRCLTSGTGLDELMGPVPANAPSPSAVADAPSGLDRTTGLTFTNEPPVEADPATGEPTARVATRWEHNSYLEFTVSLAGEPRVLEVEEFVPPLGYEEAGEILVRYLSHVSSRNFDDAAAVLGEGGVPYEMRGDLDDLGISGVSPGTLAEALADYCMPRCSAHETVSYRGLDRRRGFLLTATFGDSSHRHDFVVWGTRTGATYVRGLPPPDG